MVKMISGYKIFVGKPQEMKPRGNIGLDVRIILKLFLEKRMWGRLLDLAGSV
jgi:hypothetical protein